MGVISSYPARLYTDLDGTEKHIISDSGTTYNLTLDECLKYAQQRINDKPTVQATRTSVPTSTPLTPGQRNLWWIDTSGGHVDLSAIGTIGLLPGQTAVFRKTTADANKVFWIGTVGASGLSKSCKVELTNHFNADLREIELVWDGSTWTLIGAPTPENPGSALDNTGATDQRAALAAFLAGYSSGQTIYLPQGTILVNGGGSSSNLITFPAGTRVVGHPRGTILKFTAPSGSHSPFRPSSNCIFEDVTWQWDMSSHPGTGNDCGLVFCWKVDNLIFRRCKFFGDADTGSVANGSQLYWLGRVSPLKIWGCNGVRLEDCEVARSTGSQYGIEIVGGSYLLADNCYLHHNAADGCKILSNNDDAAYGTPSHMRWVNCRSDYNGQVIMQGQTVYTATYTTNTTISPTSGARYLVNGTFNLTLNNGTNGDTILISKLIGSGTCTIKKQDGTTIWTLDSTYDRLVTQLTYNSGTLTWDQTAVTYTNGEGWDFTGNDISFDCCVAYGNEGSGFQVKPTYVGAVLKNAAVGIRFANCAALSSWNGNGYGIVNNIADSVPREVSPQDIVFDNCLAEGNYANGFIASSATPLPILSTVMNTCVARNNGQDGISVQGACRWFVANNCVCRGNGALTVGWNVKLQGAKGVRFRDCYFSGVDPAAQSLTTETAIDTAANARCYGVLIDKSKNGTMADVVFDYCRWHNHLKTNSVTTDIRFYTADVNPATTDYSQTISSNRLALGTGSSGVLIVNSQQTATLTNSSVPSAYSGGTAYVVGNMVTNSGHIYRCISNTTGNAPPTSPTLTNTWWVEVGSDIVSFV